jgi:hypothetical protein
LDLLGGNADATESLWSAWLAIEKDGIQARLEKEHRWAEARRSTIQLFASCYN